MNIKRQKTNRNDQFDRRRRN